MSCHRGDAVAKWCERWPGRQAFCVLILALLPASRSATFRPTVVSVSLICTGTLPWKWLGTSVQVCFMAQKLSKSPVHT